MVILRVTRALRLPRADGGHGLHTRCALELLATSSAPAHLFYPASSFGARHDRGLALEYIASDDPDSGENVAKLRGVPERNGLGQLAETPLH